MVNPMSYDYPHKTITHVVEHTVHNFMVNHRTYSYD